MTEEVEVVYKVKLNYQFDAFLMFLIQDVTKRHSADILNFFGELASQISQKGFQAKKGSGGIDKQIDDYFPGTSIPFHMRVKGRKGYGDWNQVTRKYDSTDVYNCNVEVEFPKSSIYVNQQVFEKASMALMEASILETEPNDIAPFVKPDIRSPKMFKKLMDEFAGRPVGSTPAKKKKDERERCARCYKTTCQNLCAPAPEPEDLSL